MLRFLMKFQLLLKSVLVFLAIKEHCNINVRAQLKKNHLKKNKKKSIPFPLEIRKSNKKDADLRNKGWDSLLRR